jgi:hypothetical protein
MQRKAGFYSFPPLGIELDFDFLSRDGEKGGDLAFTTETKGRADVLGARCLSLVYVCSSQTAPTGTVFSCREVTILPLG